MNFKLMYSPFYDSWHVLMYDPSHHPNLHWVVSHFCDTKEEAIRTVIQLNRTEDDGTI